MKTTGPKDQKISKKEPAQLAYAKLADALSEYKAAKKFEEKWKSKQIARLVDRES